MKKAYIITTNTEDQTKGLGQLIGQSLEAGICIALVGDLGSGKTVFVKGLANGAGVPGDYYITSPTYTLVNQYPGRLPFYHVDLYRVSTTAEMESIGLYDILSAEAIIAIEWADRLDRHYLGDHLLVHIRIKSGEKRHISVQAYGRRPQLLIREIEKMDGVNLWD